MSESIITELLSNRDIDLLNEISEYISTDKTVSKVITEDGSSKIPSCPFSSRTSSTIRHDIDIDHAIRLLKREDQNVNVYTHLRRILDKIINEKPKDPLENFEKISFMLKFTYIPEKVNFERIFVDNINRNDCQKNLQMYKCAMKKQSEKQKLYTNLNTVKSEIFSNKPKKLTNVSSDVVSDDVEAHVQNLWEANHMFNKAGCGLPLDEVALLSLAMNEMTQLKKFKNIRFWGKIFGIKKTYFVIECEWTDAEIQRKLTTKINEHKSPTTGESENENDDVSSAATKPHDLSAFKFMKNPNDSESEVTSVERESLAESSATRLEEEVTGGDFAHDFESLTSWRENKCSETILETPSEIIPAEKFGIGANKYVYFVTNDLNTKWIELESVQPRAIVEARKINRYFTGNLHEPIKSFPKFNGKEIDYLRAQIARITSSTQICPRGFYTVDKREEVTGEISDNQSMFSTESIRNSSDTYDLIINQNFVHIPNESLIDPNNWAHKNPHIENNGVTNYFSLLDSPLSVPKESLYEEEMFVFEDEEHDNYIEDSKEHLYGNLNNDKCIDESAAWKGSLCSPFNSRFSFAMMKSLVWPGAYTVAFKNKMEFMYIGWAQKQETTWYSSCLLQELNIRDITKEELIECPEPIDKDINMNESKSKLSQKKKIFSSFKPLRKKPVGREKFLRDYTYD